MYSVIKYNALNLSLWVFIVTVFGLTSSLQCSLVSEVSTFRVEVAGVWCGPDLITLTSSALKMEKSIPPKRWYPLSILRGVSTEKVTILISCVSYILFQLMQEQE
jgi:hypothetical protein